ncbi:MAG TPA: PDZ domain-containing protein, partial [Pyrinomonadaceae bacterium]|nr:PDZ domain-containing protein [Pyrinomonadaceae bacterium]
PRRDLHEGISFFSARCVVVLLNRSGKRVCEQPGATRGGSGRARLLFSIAACALAAWSGLDAFAQTARTPRRPPSPVAATPSIPKTDGAATPGMHAGAPHVIAVVHRLSGWKLRTLLTPPDAPVASAFDENFVRTNIVAGYILPDGRTVVARLPQAEAEMLNLATAFRPAKSPADINGDTGLLLVRPDGTQFNARFIGLDASTGLSLLESDKPLLAPAAEVEIVQPIVGQRVRVIAPLRAELARVSHAPAVAATPRPDFAPVGDEGVLYMNLSEEAGQLREVKRSPSGKALEMLIAIDRVSPEWAGGVALSETGTLVGIIEESDARATRLMPAESVRGAARRVRERRASVPQPWLGARGDALAFAPLEQLLAGGWTREQARSLLVQPRGVLLTSVAPGTPAARAGLRPGDVVARIGRHDVRSIEDMSLMIRELGGNALADFTVLRARSAPLSLPVRLSESPSPGLDTARAELRAAQTELRAKQLALSATEENIRRHEMVLRRVEDERGRPPQPGAADARQAARWQEELRNARWQVQAAREQAQKFSAEVQLMRSRLTEAEGRYRAASAAYGGLAVKPLLAFGLEAVRISPAATNISGARGNGLLVMSVRSGSVAAGSKIQAGDIIESINGQIFSDANWNFNLSADFDAELSLGILRAGEKLSFNLPRNNTPQ